MRKCNVCGEEIHPKRLEILPNTFSCVNCSTTGKKAGVTMVIGEGDHTYNDLVIMDREDFIKYQELEHRLYGKRKDEITHPDEEEEVLEEEETEKDELEGIDEIKDLDIEDLKDED